MTTSAPSRAGEDAINAAIQGPAGTTLALPTTDDRSSEAEAAAWRREADDVSRVLALRGAGAGVSRVDPALILRLADEARRWSPMLPGPVAIEVDVPASVSFAPVPTPLAATWPSSAFGILTTPTQICVVERSSRRPVLVVDRVSLVATAPRTRIIYVPTRQKARLVAVDLSRAVDRDVSFEPGSARLTREARSQLLAVGEALQSPTLRASRFLVSGHTSATGDALANRELSFRRAVAVRDYLARTFGIAKERIQVFGFGADRPKYPTAPFEQANGRVEIAAILGGGA